jgi:hypothetical protein
MLTENVFAIHAPKVKSALGLNEIDPEKVDFEVGPSITLLAKTQ